MCARQVKSKAIVAALSLSLVSFGHAASAAIILIDGGGFMEAGASLSTQSGYLSEFLSEDSPNDMSDFDELLEVDLTLEDGSANATVKQTSSISTTSILASGEAKVSAELTVYDPTFSSYAQGDGRSIFGVSFELTTPYNFDLSGMLSSSSLSWGGGTAFVQLFNTENTFNIYLTTPNPGENPFDLSGTLFPGTYFLQAGANARDSIVDVGAPGATSSSSNFSLDMQLAPVPIPAPLLLFGSGLLGLMGFARKKAA